MFAADPGWTGGFAGGIGCLDSCLAQIVEELGAPTGPTRAICLGVREEWEQAATTPGLTDWLLDEALRHGSGESKKSRRRRTHA